MVRTLILASLLIASPAARACPEVIVPADPNDPAFRSSAWRTPLKRWHARKYDSALRSFRRTSERLEKDAQRLFRPDAEGNTQPNREIQKWLKRHVHTRHPGVLIHDDRFTYPALVWWAWSDAACRAGRFEEAAHALRRVREVRPGGDLVLHETLLMVRTGRAKAARAHLRKAPPDGFLTPYIEALIAAASGDEARARDLLGQARLAATTRQRRVAIDKELEGLAQQKR